MRRAVRRTTIFDVRRPEPRPPVYETFYAKTTAQAAARAKLWRERDPYERQIEPSLLSSNEIAKYVKQTAMLFPFHEEDLKTASYAVKFGDFSYVFDDAGGYITTKLSDCPGGLLMLPANSIVFVQCATRFRLPKYMALRFNLRIKHVHRGLLLGTGPLVDPGFDGELLIPLHNLTSEAHYVDVNSHVIWVEFTKTTYRKPVAAKSSDLVQFDKRKQNLGPKDYLDDARRSLIDGRYLPIQSSINGIMRKSVDVANKSIALSKKTKKSLFKFGLLSALAVAVAVTGIAISAFIFLSQFVQATYEQVDEARQNSSAVIEYHSPAISPLGPEVPGVLAEENARLTDIVDLQLDNSQLRSAIEELSSEIIALSKQVDTLIQSEAGADVAK